MYSTYILIDTLLLGDLPSKPWLKRSRRPSWITPIYGRDAIEVSPVIVDVQLAYECSFISQMMALVNAQQHQLGVSFIETKLTLQEVVSHLKKFICVHTENRTELTLRFADCAVLPALSKVATLDQWTALVAPFKSWKIHGRDGGLMALPIAPESAASTLPFKFSGAQIRALKDAMGADQLLAQLRIMRPKSGASYESPQAYEYACQARRMWRDAGHRDGADLIFFAQGVFDTEGRLLQASGLEDLLAQDTRTVRHELSRLLAGCSPRRS